MMSDMKWNSNRKYDNLEKDEQAGELYQRGGVKETSTVCIVDARPHVAIDTGQLSAKGSE